MLLCFLYSVVSIIFGNSMDTSQTYMPLQWETAKELVAYPDAVAAMESRVEEVVAGKAVEKIWLVEHPPLYTGGTSAEAADLLAPDQFPVYQTGRGGQFTYHGPGQRVVYCMLNVKERMGGQGDVRRFVWLLEEWVIRTLAAFGVTGERREGRVGIWVVRDNGREEKIAAIGIRLRKWVSFHGIAINVHPNLQHYAGIVPCGIQQHGVTSLHALGHTQATLAEVDAQLKQQFSGLEWT